MGTNPIFILACAIVAQAAVTPDFLSEEYIQHINDQASTWRAGKNFPEGTTLSAIQRLLGAKKSKDGVLEFKVEDNSNASDDIPKSFDAREYWSNCTSIRQIADQSKCGSCWAVAAATAISDRICIHSNGAKQTLVSAVDLMSCCGSYCGIGCDGGYPASAWSYWVNVGLVTGGAYKSGVGCKPYPFSPCNTPDMPSPSHMYPPCPSKQYPTPSCEKKCENSKIHYSEDLIRGSMAYILTGVQTIQRDILKNGPVETSFDVYSDFPHYKSGVYQITKDAVVLGSHAVRVLGWGEENGVPYWLIANSWNENWGENGLFKIIRGKDECNIENEFVAGIP